MATGFDLLGGAVSDIFGGLGDFAESGAYNTAANIATSNAQLALRSTQIQEQQQQRSLFQSEGRTQAEVVGSGFTNSGSGLDILRSSAQQGALAKQLIGVQGEETSAGYSQQAAAYAGQASAAKTAGGGGILGGILKGAAGLLSFL